MYDLQQNKKNNINIHVKILTTQKLKKETKKREKIIKKEKKKIKKRRKIKYKKFLFVVRQFFKKKNSTIESHDLQWYVDTRTVFTCFIIIE